MGTVGLNRNQHKPYKVDLKNVWYQLMSYLMPKRTLIEIEEMLAV